MITIGACRGTSSGVSIISGGINKIRKLWVNKIWVRVDTDGK
jgi:hypothetical protein